MMKIMKITKIFSLIVALIFATGCYEQFDDVPAREPISNQDEFEQMFPEAERITILELKEAFGDISNTGVNSAWSNTKYRLIGEDIFAGRDVYIKGKVISNDDEGNIYKSLHIQDHTAGIELKLNNNVGVKYKKGTWVYVRLNGLYLGNYRMMLSLGGAPSESWNKAGEHKFYANSNIEIQEIIDRHVFAGEKTELNVGTYDEWLNDPHSVDIITVTPENYEVVFPNNKEREKMFGRLIRFEGLECHYAGVKNQDGVTNPAMKSGSFENIYPSWLYTDPRPTVSKPWYHWAFKEEITGRSLYGSVCFMYDREERMNTCYEEKVDENGDTVIINKWYCSLNGVYALRTSGYSRFARQNVCKDGERATITAIYGIYAQKSDYKGNADDYASYQLTISSINDIEFENGEAALLTDEQVEALTTEDMKTVPWIDEEGESEYF
jgi:hypothetical protein